MPVSRRSAAALSLSMLTLLSAGCSTPAPAEVRAPASVDELATRSLARLDGEVRVPGLTAPVEIVRDQQGIPHIYAKNDDDLFFAQGYVMAQDRLWQLEMWRRWREGRLAEIFGPKAYEYDARTRLMMFRGPWDEPGVDELPPRRRAAVHRLGQRPQRLRGAARRQPAGGVRADRRQARAMDRQDRDAALGRRSVSTAPSGTPLEELRLARERGDARRQGSQPARRARPVGRPRGARGARREPDHRRPARGGPQGRRRSVRARRPAAARDRARRTAALVPTLQAARVLARAAGHGRQQQLGRQRQAVADRRADRLQRSAPHHRDAVAALLRAPGRRRAGTSSAAASRPSSASMPAATTAWRGASPSPASTWSTPSSRRPIPPTRARPATTAPGNRCGSSARRSG